MRHYYLQSAFLSQGWARNVTVSVSDEGFITDMRIGAADGARSRRTYSGGPRRRADRRHRRARHAQCAQSCIPARHGGKHRIPIVGARQFLDLAQRHVRPGESHRARRFADPRHSAVHRDAEKRLHVGRGIPLPASQTERRRLFWCESVVGGHRQRRGAWPASASRSCRRCTRPAISAAGRSNPSNRDSPRIPRVPARGRGTQSPRSGAPRVRAAARGLGAQVRHSTACAPCRSKPCAKRRCASETSMPACPYTFMWPNKCWK